MRGPLGLTALLAAAWLVRVALLDPTVDGAASIPLRRPLDELPLDILGAGWSVRDVPLEEDVIRRARVSSYLQRHYARGELDLWLYVGYVGSWSPESIHHPSVCFPTSGHELVSESRLELDAPGIDGGAPFKELCWRHPRSGSTYTLTSFHYNGKFEPEELRLRWDSIAGVPCFAIITLAGDELPTLEATRTFYADALRPIVAALGQHVGAPD